MNAERFFSLGAGIIGMVDKLPAVVLIADLTENRLLVVQGGKPPRWIPFEEFIVDPRGVNTGEDIDKEKRGF